ncbi:extracellular solute-binding protein [Shewanella sp. SR44-3]|uniref:extracellular solute-binding protein n=1 Tax=Shewanella sp. SR44-3 TaxID=2760936 RepID=UPI0015F7A87E|nr:extracellular solute-binding protein [Shewanella sp. SR44-3]MBB1268823.1 extracellular solute-binding protein [Shewanella sp. SR44-3]
MIKVVGFLLVCLFSSRALAQDTLNIFTWDGYVTTEDLSQINAKLKHQGYNIQAKLIQPYASGPKQMFDILRQGTCDISFLTLNYIKMREKKIAPLLQSINVNSPRLSSYANLRPELTNIPMGMEGGNPLYIPFGGGAYGIWANMAKLTHAELPVRLNDLWLPKWKGKISLTQGQVQPNIALVFLSMQMPPYHINDLLYLNEDSPQFYANRRQAIQISRGPIQEKTTRLYRQVARFWDSAPDYGDDILLTASYGIEIAKLNAQGGKWEFIHFEEGSTTWLDTINFSKHLTGKKLEAAEIAANHFISKQAQTRIVEQLGMVAASKLVDSNPQLDDNPYFFSEAMFWPPYSKTANNIMQTLSDKAMAQANQASESP